MKPSITSRTLMILLSVLSSSLALQAQVHFRHYAPGRYYDHSGVKHTGFIDFGNNFLGAVKINFREDSMGAPNQRIDISQMQALVVTRKPDTAAKGSNTKAQEMPVDSFVVVRENLDDYDTSNTEARLCKFVTAAVKAKIYSREVKKNGPGVGMGLGSFGAVSVAAGVSVSYTDTLYLCETAGKVVQIRRSNYKQLLAEAFSDYPELVQKIQTKELKFGELDEIIRRYVAYREE